MTSYALNEATGVSEIGFPEFTAKLVTDVFEALVNANLTQMEAYTELSKTMEDGLQAYINNTKNDVPPEAILELLTEKFPSVSKDSSPTVTDASALNSLVKPETPYTDETNFTGEIWTGLLDSLSAVIAQNKFTLLQNMVKQGMLRLVVDNGTIETSLTFDASSTASTYENVTDFERTNTKTTRRGSVGARLFGFFGGSSSNKTTRTTFNVSTAQSRSTNLDNTNVQITGGIKINFSTDYLKLLETNEETKSIDDK